ncbi:uncharacterized protein BDZ99DRAFT_462916 [Mytilinidion resinicola]|uniref:Uncharacterized protein n=1 Tax=Mytilinidion resinicola TaxID=574789 RepID=A0A6A6YN72_9PEZI|nr:uncharacterized protein BDZ99DRAFT_462916 [Mytilinidion resinicola]KAF2810336.1 hypothetical protein BDZ99DRAFT_462916 [Mytilinidion resinicola]
MCVWRLIYVFPQQLSLLPTLLRTLQSVLHSALLPDHRKRCALANAHAATMKPLASPQPHHQHRNTVTLRT